MQNRNTANKHLHPYTTLSLGWKVKILLSLLVSGLKKKPFWLPLLAKPVELIFQFPLDDLKSSHCSFKHGFSYSKVTLKLLWKTCHITCLARFLASSKALPLSTKRWTTFSHLLWTLISRFLMRTTSCFWLKYFKCVPVLSSSIIWSRWAFTSLAKTLWKKERKKIIFEKLQSLLARRYIPKKWWCYLSETL